MGELYLFFGLFESIANVFLTEEQAIKSVSESNHSIVCYFILLLNTDYMFSSCLLEDFSNKLRVASSDDN